MSPTGRRLDALTLLQAAPGITAARLAARLGVTERTARRDVEHLRELGYRIDAAPGRYGGYTLSAGSAMPPLLLDADEVSAVALGLRSAVAVEGFEAASVTALAKLTQVVPSRWRPRLEAIADVQAAATAPRRIADRTVLVTLALACRAQEAVRFRHRRSETGQRSARDAQPLGLVTLHGRWYFVACERDDSVWPGYAVERIGEVHPIGTRFGTPDPHPTSLGSFPTPSRTVPGDTRCGCVSTPPASSSGKLVDPSVAEVVEDGDECLLHFGTDDLDWAARWLVYTNLDLDVIEPGALTERLRTLGQCCASGTPNDRSSQPR